VKSNEARVYDCNDPETMLAGIYAKKYFNAKIIYDTHELWSDFFEIEENIIKTIYSFLNSKIVYLYETFLIKRFDTVITINEPIKKIIKKRYKLNQIHVIYNFFNYIDLDKNIKKKDSIVFIGRFRMGIEELLLKIKKRTNLEPVIIGFKGNYNEIDYKGFLNKKEYLEELQKNKIGIFSYDIKSKNIFLATPNKIFQYFQSNLPVVVMNILGLRYFKKYKFGEFYRINDEEDLILKINKILNNYDFYLDNIEKYKHELSWENQEEYVLKLYRRN